MSSPSEIVNVALIGYGMGGSLFHAPFIAQNPRLRLSAVITANAARQAEVRARYPGTAVHRHTERLLSHLEDVELVVVSTPNSSHVALAEAVLAHARAVVVDKPVAPTPDETRRLDTLARTHGTWAVPFHNRRWDGDFRTVAELLRRGDVGHLGTFESRYERWQPQVSVGPDRAWKNDSQPGVGVGILYDLGTHLIDQAVMLFGRPGNVYAEVASRRDRTDADDDAFVALDYPGASRVHLWMSAVAADQGPRFRLLGNSAAYVKTGMDVQEGHLSEGQAPGGLHWGEEPETSWGHTVAGGDRRAVPTLPGAYQLFYSGMASLLLDGTPPPVSMEDAIATAEIIEAAYLSARTGAVVPLRAPTAS
jgi:scyllo-inositol 2-dehydrogenase (NADP+)